MHTSPQVPIVDRYVIGVTYRYALLSTAYLRVSGHTRREAERNAKKVGSWLLLELPLTAEVRVPRFRGMDTAGQAIFEVPILIGECESTAKAILARLALQGSV